MLSASNYRVQDLSVSKQTINKHEEPHTGVTKWHRFETFTAIYFVTVTIQ